MRKLLLSVLIFVGCQNYSSNPIKFQSEEIKMSVDSFRVTISATYYFRNDSTQLLRAKIFYPFPIDEFHFFPDSMSAQGHDYTKSDTGISFIIDFKPNSIETLKVFYTQKLKGHQARYILTTTQNWKRPLQQAIFIIDLPDYLKNPQLSYQHDSVIKKDNRIYYYLTKKNFMPEKDLIIDW